ncbi:hypothetical protein LINPERPRIM_LOCUS11341 [Linum perenne]
MRNSSVEHAIPGREHVTGQVLPFWENTNRLLQTKQVQPRGFYPYSRSMAINAPLSSESKSFSDLEKLLLPSNHQMQTREYPLWKRRGRIKLFFRRCIEYEAFMKLIDIPASPDIPIYGTGTIFLGREDMICFKNSTWREEERYPTPTTCTLRSNTPTKASDQNQTPSTINTMDSLMTQAENLNINPHKLKMKIRPTAKPSTKFRMVGKCIGTKPISLGAAIGTARRAWTRSGQFDTYQLPDKPAFFIFTFKTATYRSLAWNHQPLVISGSLLTLRLWNGQGEPEKLNFKEIPLWLHLFNIPLCYKTETDIKTITNEFASVIEIDSSGINPNTWRRVVKVFAMVDITTPLVDCFDLTDESVPDKELTQEVTVKYERIQEYCLYCGRIAHTMETCKLREAHIKAGESGIPSGRYSFNIKVGYEENEVEEEEEEHEDWSENFDSYGFLRRQISPSPSDSSKGNAGNSYSLSGGSTSRQGTQGSRHPLNRPYLGPDTTLQLPTATSPIPPTDLTITPSSYFTPTYSYLFPETPRHPNLTNHSPLQPRNLSFDLNENPNPNPSPHNPSPDVPPGFNPIWTNNQEPNLNNILLNDPFYNQSNPGLTLPLLAQPLNPESSFHSPSAFNSNPARSNSLSPLPNSYHCPNPVTQNQTIPLSHPDGQFNTFPHLTLSQIHNAMWSPIHNPTSSWSPAFNLNTEWPNTPSPNDMLHPTPFPIMTEPNQIPINLNPSEELQSFTFENIYPSPTESSLSRRLQPRVCKKRKLNDGYAFPDYPGSASSTSKTKGNRRKPFSKANNTHRRHHKEVTNDSGPQVAQATTNTPFDLGSEEDPPAVAEKPPRPE